MHLNGHLNQVNQLIESVNRFEYIELRPVKS